MVSDGAIRPKQCGTPCPHCPPRPPAPGRWRKPMWTSGVRSTTSCPAALLSPPPPPHELLSPPPPPHELPAVPSPPPPPHELPAVPSPPPPPHELPAVPSSPPPPHELPAVPSPPPPPQELPAVPSPSPPPHELPVHGDAAASVDRWTDVSLDVAVTGCSRCACPSGCGRGQWSGSVWNAESTGCPGQRCVCRLRASLSSAAL